MITTVSFVHALFLFTSTTMMLLEAFILLLRTEDEFARKLGLRFVYSYYSLVHFKIPSQGPTLLLVVVIGG